MLRHIRRSNRMCWPDRESQATTGP
jgi:hypothetical protein